MKKNFVLLTGTIVALLMCLSVKENVKAVSDTKYDVTTCDYSPFGSMEQSETLKVKGIEVKKYCNFSNSAKAYSNFMDKHSAYFKQNDFNYDAQLGINIYDQYVGYMGDIDYSSDEQQEILSFLDVYSTIKINEEIDMLVNEINKNTQSIEEENVLQTKLYYLLPYDRNEAYDSYVSRSNLKVKSKLNVAKANTFAKKYAATPAAHNLFTSDCANFVSQILRAGGIKNESGAFDHLIRQDWYSNKKCTNKSNCAKYSTGYATTYWNNAHNFVKYWQAHGRKKTVYKKPSQATIAKNFVAGDVIAQDINGNGHVNHLGYVASRNTTNVLIAQHTTNYYKWINKTGWLTSKKQNIVKVVMR